MRRLTAFPSPFHLLFPTLFLPVGMFRAAT
jgi:hypothetical protein